MGREWAARNWRIPASVPIRGPVALNLAKIFGIDATKKGLEDRQIKLGCVQPGETSGTFGDALRKLADQATYLYVDGSRYWCFASSTSWRRISSVTSSG